MASKKSRRAVGAADYQLNPATAYVYDLAASRILAVPAPTLRRWRHEGRGPKFCRFERLVRYRVADLHDWARERQVA